MNNNNGTPLWMPRGSGRLIIAMVLTFAIVYFVGKGIEVPDALWGIAGAMLGWYVRDRVKPEV